MYKKQLKLQKIVCLFALVVAAILFLYSLGIMTDLYDSLYSTLRIRVVADEKNPDVHIIDATEKSIKGTRVYFEMQEFNKFFLKCSIAYLIIIAFLYVTNTSTRRRFYITNYIAIGLFTAASIYIPCVCHTQIEFYKNRFLTGVDFPALKEYAETLGTRYTESTMWLDLHYLVFALMFLAAALMVGICVWKVMLMRNERRLVEEGKKVKA